MVLKLVTELLISFKLIHFKSNFMPPILTSFKKISSFSLFRKLCHGLINLVIYKVCYIPLNCKNFRMDFSFLHDYKTFRIITYVFLFLARLRYPAQDSIIKILQRHADDGLVKKVRKFEKFDFKYRKVLLDFEFLQSCKKEKFIPKFLQLKVADKWLGSFEAYLSCQGRLLSQEISSRTRFITLILLLTR